MALIIAFTGKAGSGKDTAADEIKKRFPEAKHLSFAAPLKDMATKYFPFCDVVKKDPVSRATLQGLGTLMRQEVDENYWVDRLISQISPDGMYVITDLRYLNELHNIHMLKSAHNVYVIRMEGRRYEQSPELMAHPSETALDDVPFEHICHNVGTVEDIYRYLQETIHELHTRQ